MLDKIKKALGEVITYDHVGLFGDNNENCPNSHIPCGSEGSIEYEIIENPSKSALAAYVVAIWGDLRDYDDTDEIAAWFNKVLYDSGLFIRQAILTIECENGSSKTIVYKDKD
jgi:hypothetical protein